MIENAERKWEEILANQSHGRGRVSASTMLEHSIEELAVKTDYRQRLLATMMYRALGNFDVISLAASYY